MSSIANSSTDLCNQIISIMKDWSGMVNYTIIFDSDVDGNGQKTLSQTILKKKNLYFLHFDNNNNIFGGYISSLIDRTCDYIKDNTSFLFSLMRNGQVKNTKYLINNNTKYSFWLCDSAVVLYEFGYSSYGFRDLCAYAIGNDQSYCFSCSYNYNKEKNSLVENYPNRFEIQRILILEMS
ncbi:TLDc domain-containing protein [Entamoeba marina]